MSYLLDKKIKRKKFIVGVFCVVILTILFYFRLGIFNVFSSVSQTIFRPVLVFGGDISEKLKSVGSYFVFKKTLYNQNQDLEYKLNENVARNLNYDLILNENQSLKEILNRKDTNIKLVLSAILSKSNQSIYNTLVIDTGIKDGIKVGDIVFALGNVPIGRVSIVYDNSSKVTLFSDAGEKTQAIISGKDIFVEVVGRGGGNFEIIVPKDFILQKGDQIILPGIHPYVLAVTETVISDPRDSFVKALLVSPVNIQELRFVEVEI